MGKCTLKLMLRVLCGSDIEYVIEDMIKEASGGMISGTGSEQGMQGDFEVDGEGFGHCYSIDVHIDSPVYEELTEAMYDYA